jgi:UDP-N-acetyl-D-mannosaminuronic acid dehydrogenase
LPTIRIGPRIWHENTKPVLPKMSPLDLPQIDSVVVIGCGAVGLPLGVAFATRNLDVLGVDIDAERISALQSGRLELAEANLAEALRQNVAQGRLRFMPFCERASHRRAFILAVPTPVDDQGVPVLTSLQAATDAALACAQDHDLLVIRSTVPVGTTRRIARDIAGRNPTIMVACCPDRSVSGQSFLEQFSVPHVIGGVEPAATRTASQLFQTLGKAIDVSTPEAAEAVKLFCNVQRDVTFALANHFALISDALGLDIAEIEQAATIDYPRFFLSRPGPVGGPCLTKDAFLLDHSIVGRRLSPALALTARQVNASLLDHAASAIAEHLTASTTAIPIIAVLGLAFKGTPPMMDTRGSFGCGIAERLQLQWPQAIIRTWEPGANSDFPIEPVLSGADVVVLANEHPLIKGLDIAAAAQTMRPGGMIYDACGGFDRARQIPPNGVRLRIFGKGSVLP